VCIRAAEFKEMHTVIDRNARNTLQIQNTAFHTKYSKTHMLLSAKNSIFNEENLTSIDSAARLLTIISDKLIGLKGI